MTRFAYQLLLVVCITALLQWVDITQLSTFWLILYLLVVAIPLSVAQVEYPLFAHRAAVERALPEERDNGSWLRIWLWAANFKRLLAFLGALLGAWFLLILCYNLHPYYWTALYIEALAVLLITRWIQSRITRAANPEHAAMFARQFAYWIVAILLAGAFVYLGYAHVGVPELRGYDLGEVFQRAYAEVAERAHSPIVGLCLGLAAAISQVAWYLMQVLTSGMEQTQPRAIAWLIFLMPAALHALLMIRLHLGVLGTIEWQTRNDIRILGRTSSAKIFSIAFIGVIALITGLSIGVSSVDVARVGTDISDAIDEYDPCRSWSPDDTAFTEEELADIDAISQRVTLVIAQTIDREMQSIYRQMGDQVDAYLDWYYSNWTQFRLQFLYLVDLFARNNGESERGRLVANFIQLHIHENLLGPFRIKMAQANGRIVDKTNDLLDREFQKYITELEEQKIYLSSLQAGICTVPAIISIDQVITQTQSRYPTVKTAAGGAAFISGAIATKTAGKKIAAAVATKSVAKMATKLSLSLEARPLHRGPPLRPGSQQALFVDPRRLRAPVWWSDGRGSL